MLLCYAFRFSLFTFFFLFFCVLFLGLFRFSLFVLCAVGSGCFLYSLESPFWRLFFEYTSFLPIKKKKKKIVVHLHIPSFTNYFSFSSDFAVVQ